jgi:pimeloyl-ACP methyl ester carboxylesterase
MSKSEDVAAKQL